MMFEGFYIIWSGDLVFNQVRAINAYLIEDHPMISPVKFDWICLGGLGGYVIFKKLLTNDARRTTYNGRRAMDISVSQYM